MILLAAAAVLWAAGWLVLWRVPVLPRADGTGTGGVSVIIPARNEEDNLPALLASLRAQTPGPLEVLVVDDESTDRTAAVARQDGAAVRASDPLPAGWRGKAWACHQGARAARGRLLLFLDADTRLEAGALARLVAARGADGAVVSVGPYHDVPCLYEQLSAFFNTVMTAGAGACTVLGGRLRPAGLFGQTLLVDRDAYARAGGHAAVRGEILENFCLARRFREQGIPMRCYGGAGSIRMRMYGAGPRALTEGWAKAFHSGAARTPPGLMLPLCAWLSGCVLAPLGVAAAALGAWEDTWTPLAWLALYALIAIRLCAFWKRIGSFRLVTALAYPVPLAFFVALVLRSALRQMRRRPVSWKGRTIDRTAERGAAS